jgi:hypothetical protein
MADGVFNARHLTKTFNQKAFGPLGGGHTVNVFNTTALR